MKKIIIIGAVFVIALLSGFMLDWGQGKVVATFDECVAAGFPVMESYPARCRTSDGETFVQIIGSRASKAGLIELDGVPDGSTITSPLVLSGRARGPWYFEASFPVELVAEDGTVIARAVAQADGEWMTTEFVPFNATLTFASSTVGTASLVLRKDNPSGMAEFDDSLIIPVILK